MVELTAQGRPPAQATRPVLAEQQATVAIAPFDNLSRDPVDEWIGAGIAATVATELRQVLPRGARWRVVGAYQRVGDTLRITARLVDPATNVPVAVFTID